MKCRLPEIQTSVALDNLLLYNVVMTKQREFKRNNNVVYSCKYHVVFCPKYRRKVLVNGVDERLKAIIQQVADETRSEVLELEVMPDHRSRMKELQRGRLLFYVTFEGGRGYIDTVLLKEVLGVP